VDVAILSGKEEVWRWVASCSKFVLEPNGPIDMPAPVLEQET